MKRNSISDKYIPKRTNDCSATTRRFTEFLEAYFNVAYCLCCSPYRLRRQQNGSFDLHHWWLQTIVTYFLSSMYLLIVAQEFAHSVGNLGEESKRSNRNPLLYLRLVETSSYVNLIATVTFTQCSRGSFLLRFVNKVNKLQPLTTGRNSSKNTQNYQYYILLSIVSVLGSCNYFIFNNFGKVELSRLVLEARQVNSFWVDNAISNDTSAVMNLALAGSHLATCTIRNIRDIYVDLFFISGIFTLWLVSRDFKSQSWVGPRGPGAGQQIWKDFSVFRKIAALSRAHSDVFGYGLCCYLAYQISYYSLHLDNVFATKAGLGQRFYYFEFMLSFGLVFICGAHHLHQMRSLRAVPYKVDKFKDLNPNQAYLITYWSSSNYPAIRAKVFPINFNTLFHFTGQVMVIFLIAVQSKVSAG